MPRKRRPRRQRVVLRGRQKTERNHRWGILLSGLLGLILIGGLGSSLVLREQSWFPRWIQAHTPHVQIEAATPELQTVLASAGSLDQFNAWFPWKDRSVRQKMLQDHPEVGGVRFERHFRSHVIIARVSMRIPLVLWENRGVDGTGHAFQVADEKAGMLPKASFATPGVLPIVGPWLASMSRIPEIWNNVTQISAGADGFISFDAKTGTHVVWGMPDTSSIPKKAQCLARVLDDAHQRLGGAASADLRFFDEGRIVVRPKRVG